MFRAPLTTCLTTYDVGRKYRGPLLAKTPMLIFESRENNVFLSMQRMVRRALG